MDPNVLKFAQVMAILVPVVVVLTAMGVIAHRVVETTNRRTQLPAPREDLSDDRLRRLETAVDAIAIEVERISEAQRFTTKLLVERTPAKQD